MLPAARVGDSIKHENWTDSKAEPALVIATSMAIIVSGGGVALFLSAVSMAGIAGGGLDAVFGFVMSATGERITTGAATVFTNLKAAALAHPKCKVFHGVVESGAEHVFIEEGNASRLRDLTTCPGYITEGSKKPNQVLIGGRSVKHARPGWYTAFRVYQMTVSAVNLASSLRALSSGFTLGKLGKVGGSTFGTTGKALELGTGRTPLQTGADILDRIMD